MPESLGEERCSFDAAGAVTLTSGLLLLIFTLGEATNVGWGAARTIASLVGVAVLLGAFVVIETRVPAPIMPLTVFRRRTLRTANLAAVLVFGTFSAMFFFASIFMQHVYGYSPLEAGLAYVPLAVSVAIGSGVASGLMARIAARRILVTGLLVVVGGLLLLWRAPADGSYAADLLIPFLALGLGCGVCYVTLQIAAFVGVSDDEAGLGAGLINTSQEVGGALGLAVVATIAYSGMSAALAAAGDDPTLIRAAQAAANHDAFLAATCLASAALLLAGFLMPRPTRRIEPEPAVVPVADAIPAVTPVDATAPA